MDSQQMIKLLLPTRQADSGAACTKCCRPHPNLVACSACRRARYCGRACQKSDWKQHKPVCKILRAFGEQSKGMADSTTASPIAGGKHNLVDKFARFKAMVAGGPPYGADSPLNGLPRDIPETAWQLAKGLVMRSPCCAICQKTDYDYVGTEGGNGAALEWKRCLRCNHGWCCAQHIEGYLGQKHTKDICDTYIKSNSLELFRYNHTVEQGDRFLAMPSLPLSMPMRSFPTSWSKYFRKRMPEEHRHSQNGRLPPEYLPAATFLLSQVTTCLQGMYQHDRHFFTTAEELTIHVLGPTQSFECEGGGPTCIWEEIMHCLPSVNRMDVVFVGPEFAPEGGISFPSRPLEACPDCTSKGRIRMQGFYKMTYHDYYNSGEFTRPDFAVAFNTGMFEEDTESWKESLGVLLSLNVPCIFTSYNKHEGDADFKVLRELNARTLTDTTVLNPFCVNIPNVDDGCIDKFFQCNLYCVCFRGHA